MHLLSPTILLYVNWFVQSAWQSANDIPRLIQHHCAELYINEKGITACSPGIMKDLQGVLSVDQLTVL